MKRLIFVLVTLIYCCMPLQAAQIVPDKPFALTIEEKEQLIEECLAAMNNVLSTYEGIKDTASADAAAGRLTSLHMLMQEKVDTVNKIDQSDAATQNLFFTKLLPMLFVNGARTKDAFSRIRENDYYGSYKLREFMESLKQN